MRRAKIFHPSLDEVKEAFRNGLQKDNSSEAAGLAFDAMSAFNQRKYHLASQLIHKSFDMNRCWSELFHLLKLD
jgi:hypothetical protein